MGVDTGAGPSVAAVGETVTVAAAGDGRSVEVAAGSTEGVDKAACVGMAEAVGKGTWEAGAD